MLRALLLAFILSACASAQTFVGTGTLTAGASSGGGGGGGADIVPAFTCRAFGQTADAGGTLNIKYATPMTCWATATTVEGVAVNDAGWVPEVYFEWDWDDATLGTVSRGGLTRDLGASVGVVAAHAFLPSAFAETCNGGTNSLHTVTLTVRALVSGERQSAAASLNVCVENPATTWPTPVAFCDDADCSNDTFSNVVNPGTPSHGGNGTALHTILDYCDNNGSQRILVEGGVTFTTGTDVTISGANRCLIESYGTGNAKFKFTSTAGTHSIIPNQTTGYVLMDVTFAGNGDDNHGLITPTTTDKGYFALINTDMSSTAGEEMANFTVANSAVTVVEAYWIKAAFDYGRNAIAATSTYLRCQYCGWVGGSLTASQSHTIRLANWNHVAIDAMLFSNIEKAHAGDTLVRLMHDCGTVAACTDNLQSGPAAITRGEFTANDTASKPFQVCLDGHAAGEPTNCVDTDVIANVFRYDATTGVDQFFTLETTGHASSGSHRWRFIQNAFDITAEDSTTSRFVTANGATDQLAFIGNVIVDTGSATSARVLANGSSSVIDVAKNNACFDAGNLCDMFTGLVESADNVEASTNPFSVSPGQFAAFDFTDVTIANGSAFDDVGVLPPYLTDVAGGACDSLYDTGPYCTP
jgi:hypothetical protein